MSNLKSNQNKRITKTVICASCHDLVPKDDLHFYEGFYLCNDCAKDCGF